MSNIRHRPSGSVRQVTRRLLSKVLCGTGRHRARTRSGRLGQRLLLASDAVGSAGTR